MKHLARGRAHAKKRHLCTKQFRRTYSWGQGAKKKGHVHYVCVPTGPCTAVLDPYFFQAIRSTHFQSTVDAVSSLHFFFKKRCPCIFQLALFSLFSNLHVKKKTYKFVQYGPRSFMCRHATNLRVYFLTQQFNFLEILQEFLVVHIPALQSATIQPCNSLVLFLYLL